jgi:hypothetical protein
MHLKKLRVEMAKYRKKPVEIEAIQWIGTNLDEIRSFINVGRYYISTAGDLVIPTLEGDHIASKGDFIIKGVRGELYPCKPDIFRLTYDYVGE